MVLIKNLFSNLGDYRGFIGYLIKYKIKINIYLKN